MTEKRGKIKAVINSGNKEDILKNSSVIQSDKEAWILSVDMGYGHQRAAYPLKDVAHKRIITANNDILVPPYEKKTWIKTQHFYERISRMKEIPLIGNIFFEIYDQLQKISPFFPFRDLSKPNFSVMYTKKTILKKKLCLNIIEEIRKTNHPVIASHFIPALACEYFGMKNNIYCMITDSDLNRVWVSDNPKNSKIIYLAPCRHAVVRLRQYGVPEDKIILTGFPLPKENLGNESLNIAKYDFENRLPNLDPKGKFEEMYKEYITKVLGKKNIRKNSDHILTITYLVGGAGAQKKTGIIIAKSLKLRIARKEIKLNLVAGTNTKILEYFNKELKKNGLEDFIGNGIDIIHKEKKSDYFSELNKILRITDIIWTKPSELCFYTALGLPVIMAPPIGAHEIFNKEWLEHIGSGIVQENPEFVNDWLFYWIEEGRFAEAALDGFTRAPNRGTFNIEIEVFSKKKKKIRV